MLQPQAGRAGRARLFSISESESDHHQQQHAAEELASPPTGSSSGGRRLEVSCWLLTAALGVGVLLGELSLPLPIVGNFLNA